MKKIVGVLFISFILASCSDAIEEYTVQDALEKKDVVIKENGQPENLEKLLLFIDKVKESKRTTVNVTTFTNRKTTINELNYDGTNINYTIIKDGTKEKSKQRCL